MPDRISRIAGFNNVTAGSIAVTDAPLGRRYHSIVLRCSATSQTDAVNIIDDVSIVVNGRSIRTLTPARLRAINSFSKNGTGGADYSGSDPLQLVFHFREPSLKTSQEEHSLCLGTGDISSLRIEVRIKSGITAPALSGYYVYDDAVNAKGDPVPSGVVKRTKIDTLTSPGAGDVTFRNLSFEGVVKRLHIENASTITALEMRSNDRIIWEGNVAELNALYIANGLTPITGYTTIPFDILNDLYSGIPADQLANFALKLTFNAAATATVVHEFYAKAV
jgi:hypothetical protein